MFLLEQFFIGLERTIWVTLVVHGQCSIAEIPFNLFLSIQILLDRINIQKYVDALMVNARIISILMQALLVEIGQIRIGQLKLWLNPFLYLFTKLSSKSAFWFIFLVELFWNKETVSQSFHCEVVEKEVAIALFGHCTGIEHQKTFDVQFQPSWNLRVFVMFYHVEG